MDIDVVGGRRTFVSTVCWLGPAFVCVAHVDNVRDEVLVSQLESVGTDGSHL